MSHPTPWVIDTRFAGGSRATAIYDDRGELVETVYGRDGDPIGEALAQRICDAVNGRAREGCGDPDCSCPECPTGQENDVHA